jgi:hypothetical protein
MSWFGFNKGKETRKPTLHIELLERRDCPASIGVFGHTMVVFGDANANTVTITDDGQGGVAGQIDSLTASGTNVSRVLISTGRNSDVVNYSLTGALSRRQLLAVDLGWGNDTATFTATVGISAGGLLSLGVEGNLGSDTITANVGSIAAQGAAFLAFDGGSGEDTTNFGFSGALNGGLNFYTTGGSGNDTTTALLTIDAGSTGRLRGRVDGGSGNDTLTFNITDNTEVEGETGLATFVAVICGGSGSNTLTHTDNVTVCN